MSDVLGKRELPKELAAASTLKIRRDCKLEPKENPGKEDGIDDELNAGKLELNSGKPIEEDNGVNDNGPSNSEDDGKIKGADNEYHNGNELEAKGAPEKDDNGNAKGTDDKLKRGKELDKELNNAWYKLDHWAELPKGAKERANGAAELLNKGCKELNKDTNGNLDGPTLGCDGLDIPEVNKLSGKVNKLNKGSTAEVANACDDTKGGSEGVIDNCTDIPLGKALGSNGKLPGNVEGKLGTAKKGVSGVDNELKLIKPGKDGLASSLRGL